MPHDAEILGLKGYEIKDIRRDVDMVRIQVRYTGPVSCPRCGGVQLRKKDAFVRKLRHESWGRRQCELHLQALKFHCLGCGRYFNQRFPAVAPRRRSTELFRWQVFWQHFDGIGQKRLSEREQIGTATIERWFHELLGHKLSQSSNKPCPRVLGIDEHFFTRKKGYATTFCDLGHHSVYDVVLGRSEAALEDYLSRLQGKENVRVVCIDLSSTYRNLIRKHFPNARIVADRFHVIRVVNHHFMATWAQLDPTGRKNRGLLSLMRRNENNLSPEQKHRLESYLDTQPALKHVYAFKQKLCRLLCKKHCTARRARKYIRRLLEYIRQLKYSGIEQLELLGRTLGSWDEEIATMWRFTKNNGITEGFHNKMEMISRRAFGFRNFENYRLRVRVMCA
jgi:transposase